MISSLHWDFGFYYSYVRYYLASLKVNSVALDAFFNWLQRGLDGSAKVKHPPFPLRMPCPTLTAFSHQEMLRIKGELLRWRNLLPCPCLLSYMLLITCAFQKVPEVDKCICSWEGRNWVVAAVMWGVICHRLRPIKLLSIRLPCHWGSTAYYNSSSYWKGRLSWWEKGMLFSR